MINGTTGRGEALTKSASALGGGRNGKQRPKSGAHLKEVIETMEQTAPDPAPPRGDRLRVSPLRKVVEITLGVILVVLGLIGGLLPVVQGWMLGVPGLILLARHFKWARRMLDWAKGKWNAARAGGPPPDR